ncbi:MAG: VTT domain-containing protein [Flavobacteriales bacterium]|nr:VTT domain-containing protein [Flavobacteriales bacterium]
MQEFFELVTKLFIPENLIKLGGVGLLLFIVFAETGLFVGFFLPGDSLLFTAGILCRMHVLDVSILTLMIGLNLAAITGNLTGYYFGKRMGPRLFTRNDSWIFKKRYVTLTKTFYDKHGGKALILGRFLPIIRTFAPILSGVIEMNLKTFFTYTFIGSILWTSAMTLSAYYLSKIIPGLEDHLGLVVLFLIVITAIPVITTYRKERREMNQKNL